MHSSEGIWHFGEQFNDFHEWDEKTEKKFCLDPIFMSSAARGYQNVIQVMIQNVHS